MKPPSSYSRMQFFLQCEKLIDSKFWLLFLALDESRFVLKDFQVSMKTINGIHELGF